MSVVSMGQSSATDPDQEGAASSQTPITSRDQKVTKQSQDTGQAKIKEQVQEANRPQRRHWYEPIWNCHKSVLVVFYNYGYWLGSYPVLFLLFPLVVCGLFAIGIIQLHRENDVEALYTPMDSRAVKDRAVVVATFPDLGGSNYHPFSRNTLDMYGVVILHSKKHQDILSDETFAEIQSIFIAIHSLNATSGGQNYTYADVCARMKIFTENCAVMAARILFGDFRFEFDANQVFFPTSQRFIGMDLSMIFGDVVLDSNNTLVSAGSMKLIFVLRKDTPKLAAASAAWEHEFLKFMSQANFSAVSAAYAISNSLNEELEKGTKGDIKFFSMTFALMITFACIVSSGGDCVSTRSLMVNLGVVGVVFGIFGAFGVVSMYGVSFVNIVGCMPFLILGIGVDDMFLLMSCWSETLSSTSLTVPERMGTVFKKAGIGITITSVTDFLAFAIGTTSKFKSVRNFCIYSGVAVILCYFCNAMFFGACLALHGRRVYARRHAITLKKVPKSREELKQEGRSALYVHFCGGKIPESADEEQSILEKGPRKSLVRFVLWTPVKVGILVFFSLYLAVSIYGITELKQGLELKDLVLKSSYYHTFQLWDHEDFGVKIPVSFVTTTTKEYWNAQALNEAVDLIEAAKEDPLIDPRFESCWLITLARTNFYNMSSPEAFLGNLKKFLEDWRFSRFKNDVVFGDNDTVITASRCQVLSYRINSSNEEAELMLNMRKLADGSPGSVFAYHPAFIFYEQYVEILPSTIQTVLVTLLVMFIATAIFLPHPMMVLLVMIQVIMIIVGIFGLMTLLWGLTLSSVTMIHLIMSVGFSVDFCAHVCTAYLISDETTREGRARDAIVHAASPIFNSGMSSLLGVLVLLFTESYIFQSFFKIMFLVIGLGIIHAAFLIPVILSYIGPRFHVHVEE